MKVLKYIIFILVFSVLMLSGVKAAINNDDIQYAKQYLIVLVHGIGDDHACFDKVKEYLESVDLNGDSKGDLVGYVYAYEFSDKFLNIEKEGWEFGDRTYDNPEAVSKDSDEYGDGPLRRTWEITKRLDNGRGGTGKSWLEQAREDFRIWYHNEGPGSKEDPKRYAGAITKSSISTIGLNQDELWNALLEAGYIKSNGDVLLSSEKPDDFKITLSLSDEQNNKLFDILIEKKKEIPPKFIVIAHSMGGLAVRSYILGKDHNGNRYYTNDIEKLITIDTPHSGSGAAQFAKNFDESFTDSYLISAGCLGLAIGNGMMGNKSAARFFAGENCNV